MFQLGDASLLSSTVAPFAWHAIVQMLTMACVFLHTATLVLSLLWHGGKYLYNSFLLLQVVGCIKEGPVAPGTSTTIIGTIVCCKGCVSCNRIGAFTGAGCHAAVRTDTFDCIWSIYLDDRFYNRSFHFHVFTFFLSRWDLLSGQQSMHKSFLVRSKSFYLDYCYFISH